MDSTEGNEPQNFDSFPIEQENENFPLRTMDIIDSINNKLKKKSEKKLKQYIKITIILIFAFIILLFIIFFIFKYKRNDNDYYLEVFKPNIKSKIRNHSINIDLKELNNNSKKINVGFIYSTLTGNGISRFMIVTAEYFINSGKFNVYFFTKPKSKKELKYNEKIKRIYGYENNTLIEKVCKEEKIDFLIINNNFDSSAINWFKTLGAKIIGIFHGVYISPMFNNVTSVYRSWKYTELYDAFIHISADDYYFYKNLGFKKNIFIPNLYTFDPSEALISNLTNHNIMMLGRLTDKKKGTFYAIKAMSLIVKEVPDAKLNLVSSDYLSEYYRNLIKQFNLTNNIFYTPFTPNVSEFFLNNSVFLFPSLTEAFPMALNEAKAHGLPCVTFDVSYSIPLQTGVIKVDTFDYEGIAKETIKLLKNYTYRVEMGNYAKLSLNRFNNWNTTNLWIKMFNALEKGENEYQKLRKEIEDKYYNEKIAEKHMEKQFEYLKRYNKFFRCHSLKNMANLNYINNIEECQNVTNLMRKI